MTAEIDRENSRQRARFVAGRLAYIEGWSSLAEVDNGANTWRWTNALVFAIGESPIRTMDARLVVSGTSQVEVVAVTDDRIIYATGHVDGSYPVIRVFPRRELNRLEILEPGAAVESTIWLVPDPNPRVRLGYGAETMFCLPMDESGNRRVSREVESLLPSLYIDLGLD